MAKRNYSFRETWNLKPDSSPETSGRTDEAKRNKQKHNNYSEAEIQINLKLETWNLKQI
jgi:hypothetical protein